MSKFICNVKSVLARDEGATMVEYGLMVALIAIVAIGGAADIGDALSTLFTTISASL